jgi:SAM-dependent methyltransferase
VKKLEYVFGHSQREIQRLIYQAAIVKPVTERLLRTVKPGPGMRVLDLGCGAGDVSMLAAQYVGPTGLVIGIDRNRDVLAWLQNGLMRPNCHKLRLNRQPVCRHQTCSAKPLSGAVSIRHSTLGWPKLCRAFYRNSQESESHSVN